MVTQKEGNIITEFINIKDDKTILITSKVPENLIFIAGEEVIIERVYYKFVKRTISIYKDADGWQVAISIFLEQEN